MSPRVTITVMLGYMILGSLFTLLVGSAAVQAIPDLLFTPLNVTADLSVAVIARRVWRATRHDYGLGFPGEQPEVATAE